jgi:hypothetical protein
MEKLNMTDLQKLIQRYIDYSVENMDMEAMELFVKDVMMERMVSMSEESIRKEIAELAPELETE